MFTETTLAFGLIRKGEKIEMTATDKPIFVRRASGLVREMDLKDIILWNSVAAGIGLGEVSFLVPYYLSLVPGANFILGGVLAIIGGLLVAACYAHFLSAMPRSGGEYVFLSRLTHPLIGFFFSFSMAMLWVLAYAINMQYSASIFVPFVGNFIGSANIPAFWFTPNGIFIVSFLMSFAALAVTVAGMRAYIRYQLVITAISALAMILFAIVLINIGSQANFQTMFNNFAGQYYPGVADPYNYIMSQAQGAGYQLPSSAAFSFGQTLGMMVIFGFAGLLTCATFSSFVAGEMKRADSGRRQLAGLWGGLILNGVLAILLSVGLMAVINPNFIGALAYAQFNPDLGLFKLPTILLTMPFSLLEWLAPSPIFGIIIDLALWLLALTWAIMDLIVLSRLFFAWSFDRLLPSGITHVSDRFKTPTYAIGAAWILGIVFGGLTLVPNYNIAALLSAAGWLVFTVFIAVGLTAIVFPFAKKKLYETMPMKSSVAGIPVLSIAGILTVIFFGAMASVYIWGPDYAAAGGAWTNFTTYTLAFFYIAAIVIYAAAYFYWKQKGLDLSLAFKEIPPA
jgi:APA family basic amino acid/polyamine antiporter